jgi:hypothetical protein
MVKLKKSSVRIVYCPTCKGNGHLKVATEWGDTIHQCWDCDSEGEYYVHQPEADIVHNDADYATDNDSKLH